MGVQIVIAELGSPPSLFCDLEGFYSIVKYLVPQFSSTSQVRCAYLYFLRKTVDTLSSFLSLPILYIVFTDWSFMLQKTFLLEIKINAIEKYMYKIKVVLNIS